MPKEIGAALLVDLMLGAWEGGCGSWAGCPSGGESDAELLLQAKREPDYYYRDKELFQACLATGRMPAHPLLSDFRSAPGDGRCGCAPAT
jgi:hypothetical protein